MMLYYRIPKHSANVFIATLLTLSCGCLLCQLPAASEAFFIDEHQSPAAKHWSYGDQSNWKHSYAQCGLRNQSPVDIAHSHVIYSKNLKLQFYNYNKPVRFNIRNAHHTVKLNPIYEKYSWIHNQDPTLRSAQDSGAGDDSLPDDGGDIQDLITLQEELSKQQTSTSTQRTPSRLAASRFNANSNNNSNNYSNNNNGKDDARAQQQAATSTSSKYNAADDDEYNQQGNARSSGSSSGAKQFAQQQPDAEKRLPYDGQPTIKLNWLDDGNNEFTLEDIHFHWDERKDNGSEHAIEGRRGAMEMHLVHIKRGLDKSQISYTSDSVAVIGVVIESYKKSNADFNPIVNALSAVNATERLVKVSYNALENLLPTTLNAFYTYSGSLTTPPCLEVVNWILIRDRLYLNAKQMEMFRNMYAPSSAAGGGNAHRFNQMMPNVRHLNPVNNRVILSSFYAMNMQTNDKLAGNSSDVSSLLPEEYSSASGANSTLTFASHWLIRLLLLALFWLRLESYSNSEI